MHHRTLSKEIRKSVIFRYEKQMHHNKKGMDYPDDARKQPKVVLATKIIEAGKANRSQSSLAQH
jgi:hypothetical protein